MKALIVRYIQVKDCNFYDYFDCIFVQNHVYHRSFLISPGSEEGRVDV